MSYTCIIPIEQDPAHAKKAAQGAAKQVSTPITPSPTIAKTPQETTPLPTPTPDYAAGLGSDDSSIQPHNPSAYGFGTPHSPITPSTPLPVPKPHPLSLSYQNTSSTKNESTRDSTEITPTITDSSKQPSTSVQAAPILQPSSQLSIQERQNLLRQIQEQQLKQQIKQQQQLQQHQQQQQLQQHLQQQQQAGPSSSQTGAEAKNTSKPGLKLSVSHHIHHEYTTNCCRKIYVTYTCNICSLLELDMICIFGVML